MKVFNSIEKSIKHGVKPCNVGKHGKHCVHTPTENFYSKKETGKAIRRKSKEEIRNVYLT